MNGQNQMKASCEIGMDLGSAELPALGGGGVGTAAARRKDLASALAAFPRVRLGHLPTPLEPMDRLSEHLRGPRFWVKRDDCTGLASGGNKTRKLEFLMAEALDQGADTIITQGATQSNHARQSAAAALEKKCPGRDVFARIPSHG